MTLLDPPILCTLELHVTADGHARFWTTPRDLRAYPPEARIRIAQCVEAQVDQLFTELGVRRRLKVLPTLTPEQAQQLLDP